MGLWSFFMGYYSKKMEGSEYLLELHDVAEQGGDAEGYVRPEVAMLVVENAAKDYKSLLTEWLRLFDVLPDADRPKIQKVVRELAERTRATLGEDKGG
jgi:hypothetical protein